jgi:hypothetical protein
MASQGRFSGGKRPFGWDIVEEDQGSKPIFRLVPNADEQAKLVTMKGMKAAHKSLRDIGAAVGIKHAGVVKRILERSNT